MLTTYLFFAGFVGIDGFVVVIDGFVVVIDGFVVV
jgi:hypothetical protein